jgi:tellurite resistance protein TerC
VVKDGVRWFTPLFVVVMLIGVVDIVFAVDSIPAIFAITDDPFIVLTSNVFAVLGLRAMYFLLAEFASRFHLLNYGLSIVLIFIGVKMLIVDFYKIPITYSLSFVFIVLTLTIVASLLFPVKPEPAEATEGGPGTGL